MEIPRCSPFLPITISPLRPAMAARSLGAFTFIHAIKRSAVFQQNFPRMITAMAFDPKSSVLAVASEDAAIRLFGDSLGERKSEAKSLPGHDERVGDLVFSSDSSVLFSVSNDGTMRQWAVNASSQTSLADLATEYSWLHPTASHDGATHSLCESRRSRGELGTHLRQNPAHSRKDITR